MPSLASWSPSRQSVQTWHERAWCTKRDHSRHFPTFARRAQGKLTGLCIWGQHTTRPLAQTRDLMEDMWFPSAHHRHAHTVHHLTSKDGRTALEEFASRSPARCVQAVRRRCVNVDPMHRVVALCAVTFAAPALRRIPVAVVFESTQPVHFTLLEFRCNCSWLVVCFWKLAGDALRSCASSLATPPTLKPWRWRLQQISTECCRVFRGARERRPCLASSSSWAKFSPGSTRVREWARQHAHSSSIYIRLSRNTIEGGKWIA